MRIVKQKKRFTIRNFDNFVPRQTHTMKRHGNLFPSNMRCLIVGPSDCGKTNILVEMLANAEGIFFENVYVYSKSLNQQKYQYLRDLFHGIVNYVEFTDSDEMVLSPQMKPNSVIIFDDVACSPQSGMRHYFSFGRHLNVDCFYLCQTYSTIPKQLVRDNANFIIIFKQDETNLKHVYYDHVSPDMTFKEFLKVCAECWKESHGCLVINKEANITKGRYRKNIDGFIYL